MTPLTLDAYKFLTTETVFSLMYDPVAHLIQLLLHALPREEEGALVILIEVK